MAWTHRPALDGVRSIAVYVVLLFHAGLPFVDGGFLGVDLFFVLSGFLVSSILLDELDETGRVRLWRFYARRVRRLLPAALVVIVATAAVFVLLASSVRRAPMVGDAQASLLYAANWRFLAQENDYFGADVDRSPYLHFWSLSIEEQFYFAFPLVLLGLFAVSRRWRLALPVGVGALLTASVAAQVVWASRDANHAYYGTDARAYQLMAGVLAALALRALSARATLPPMVARVSAVLAPVGLLVLLVACSGLVDTAASTRGLVATVGSTALILGLVLGDRQPLGRLLGRPLPVYLGRISYGTYLWHWPVVLVLLEFLDTSPWVIAGLTAGLATALAALSFEVLEHPVRRARVLSKWAPQTVAVGLAASVAVALVVAPPLLGSDRRPALATSPGSSGGDMGSPVPTDVDWLAYIDDKGPDDTYCTPADLSSCVVATSDSGPHVTLIGDSNARMLAPVLQQLATENGFTLSLQILNGCPWQHRIARLADTIGEVGERCRATRDDMYDTVLRDLDVDVAVLLQLPRDRGRHQRQSGMTEPELDEFNYSAQESSLDELAGIGADTIIMEPIIQVPRELPEPLECLATAVTTAECRVPVPINEPPSAAFARALGAQRADTSSVSVNDLMCPTAPLCEPLVGRVPVWRDREHYTPAALDRVRDYLWKRLAAATDSFVS
jgi:peptidoglycan/LPS O-acetylase OafA/YrhL